MQTATTPKEQTARESGVFTKRTGSTNYRMSVHFSKTGRESGTPPARLLVSSIQLYCRPAFSEIRQSAHVPLNVLSNFA